MEKFVPSKVDEGLNLIMVLWGPKQCFERLNTILGNLAKQGET